METRKSAIITAGLALSLATGAWFDKFFFLRGSPILLAVTKSGSNYTFFASVGGTEVSVRAETLSGVSVSPSKVKFGNSAGVHPESMYWYGGKVDVNTAESSTSVSESLHTLSFLALE
ncbi:MAG TPA: hypothetical protein VHN77_12540 [Phycisphaerales bacterium]|nr:hypothetical protein [Phycisphaerales bacterium]